MNITERIEQVLDQRGISKSELARRMNKHNQQVNRLIDNPKWETIESVANAIGIAPWELFTQEIEAAGYRLATEQQPSAQPAAESASVEQQQVVSDEPSAIGQQAIVCPHCHQALVFNIAAYEQK